MNYKYISTILITLSVISFTQPLNLIRANENTQITQTKESVKPKRLTIKIGVESPEDLKISEGEVINKGQIIGTREKLKTRLYKQLDDTKTAQKRLINLKPLPPNLPKEIPPLAILPPISYLEFEADIERKKIAITFIEDEIKVKQSEIDYLSSLEELDKQVIAHEKAKLKKLKEKLTIASKDYQLSQGKFESAKNQRKYQEYQAQLDKTRRIENINQQRLNYDRQLAIYKKELTDYEIKLKTLNDEINEITEAIANDTNIISPYSGTIRRIKLTNQSPDGTINGEISLIVKK